MSDGCENASLLQIRGRQEFLSMGSTGSWNPGFEIATRKRFFDVDTDSDPGIPWHQLYS